jgi:shikimate kinase
MLDVPVRFRGAVVYLKVEFDDILKRMNKKEIEKRPLFKDKEKAKELFEKRSKIYEQLADFVVENNNIKQSVEKIKEYYESFKSKHKSNSAN